MAVCPVNTGLIKKVRQALSTVFGGDEAHDQNSGFAGRIVLRRVNAADSDVVFIFKESEDGFVRAGYHVFPLVFGEVFTLFIGCEVHGFAFFERF